MHTAKAFLSFRASANLILLIIELAMLFQVDYKWTGYGLYFEANSMHQAAFDINAKDTTLTTDHADWLSAAIPFHALLQQVHP